VARVVPPWLTLLGQAKDSLWSLDLFRVESVLLQTHWILVVMDQFTRRIIGFGLQAGAVDGLALCRTFNQAIAGQGLPVRLSLDHDPLFGLKRWRANLRVLEIQTICTVPYVPVSHPFFERLIGTIRREPWDRCLFWNFHDLEQKLVTFRCYCNRSRVHQGLAGDTPEEMASAAAPPQRASLQNYT